MHNLFQHVYPILLSSGEAVSGTSTDWYTDCVDTRGYEGVAFICNTETSDLTDFHAYAQLSATSSGTGTFIDVYGSTVTHTTGFTASDPALLIVDLYRPVQRWARMYFDRETTGELVTNVIALLYRPQLSSPGWSTGMGIADLNIVIGASSS
jgi:hypothetical protein